MKKYELMIGDWVSHICLPYKYGIVTAIDIRSRFVTITKHDGSFPTNVSFDKIIPIQITEEILNANGFSFDNYQAIYDVDENHSFVVEGLGEQMYITIAWGVEVDINYVHELQNVLRQCGLTELADNFKIE